MDSEEELEIKELRSHGKPETTEGPYYHKTWWEGYKGGVKGTLGGIIIGGALGAGIGGAILGALALASVPVTGSVGLVLAASSAFGMYKGATKFESVGVTAGAISASQEVSEVRMKEYVREQFRGVRNEIRELKGALTNTPTELLPVDTSPVLKEEDFRTTHCDEHCTPETRSYIYPTVMTIGALVGTAAGAIFGFSDMGHHIVELVLGDSIAPASIPVAMTATGAAIGASFGISRDLFRSVFDVTDRLFMGVVTPADEKEKSPSPTRTYNLTKPVQLRAQEPAISTQWAPPSQRVLMSPSPDVTLTESPILSATHHQDKLANAARQALLGMDHTTAIKQ
jgi:hypothetical protein